MALSEAEAVMLATAAAEGGGGEGHQAIAFSAAAACGGVGMKSSGLTLPPVASRIRTSFSPGGNTSPLHQRETALCVAPTFFPKAAIVVLDVASQTRSFMASQCASDAHARQAQMCGGGSGPLGGSE